MKDVEQVRSRIVVFFLALGMIFLAAWPGICQGQLTVPYTVRIEGVEEELQAQLESVSRAIELKDEPPATMGLLRRRAQTDVSRLLEVLRADGYYGAEVKLEIDLSQEPVSVVFNVQTGPVYKLVKVEIEPEDGAEIKPKLPTLQELDLQLNGPAKARPILSAHEAILKRMRAEGYALVRMPEPQVVVDHTAREVSVKYRIIPGPESRFGPTRFSGLESVREEFLQKILPWREGERFNAELLTEARNRLTETQLFSLVNITQAESLNEDGRLPITIEVRERKHRTISAGASYYTDEGFGTKLGWEHRNLFKEGERFTFEAKLSEIGISGETTFRKPAFVRPDQTLIASFRIAEDDTDAYVSQNTELAVLLERRIRKGMRVALGSSFRLAQVEQLGQTDEFALISIPALFEWDASDNLLNPTRGFRLNFRVSPYQDTLDEDLRFIKAAASFSYYHELLEKPSVIFAARAALGTMGGASRNDIPADVRFYAGGGGSVRGYPFQTVGPLVGAVPIGGRSLVELSGELRWKITDKIGVVGFLDGGSVFEAAFPDFEEDLLWGAGAGVRYFTPIGPIRLDIATPLNRRDQVDDALQLYISIGQAF